MTPRVHLLEILTVHHATLSLASKPRKQKPGQAVVSGASQIFLVEGGGARL